MIIAFITRLGFAAYFMESGLILMGAPWSRYWDDNWFVTVTPRIGDILTGSFARGAVTGIGIVTVVAGIVELAGAFASRRARSASEPHQV